MKTQKEANSTELTSEIKKILIKVLIFFISFVCYLLFCFFTKCKNSTCSALNETISLTENSRDVILHGRDM